MLPRRLDWEGDPFQESLREVAAAAVTHGTRKEREGPLRMAHTVSRKEMKGGSGGQPLLQALPIPLFSSSSSPRWQVALLEELWSSQGWGETPPEAVNVYLRALHLVAMYLWFKCEWRRACWSY